MASKYLIPEPTEKATLYGGEEYATKLYGQSYSYYVKKENSETHKETWWAIGMIFRKASNQVFVDDWVYPIVVSNVADYAVTASDNFRTGGEEGGPEAFYYDGLMYYYGYKVRGEQIGTSIKNAIIPVNTDKAMEPKEAAKKLIDLYLADGGTLPGEEPEPEPSPSQEYSKVEYTRINWENKSTSLKTPINESNLNKMDKAISDLCKNLDIAHTESDVKKLDKSLANKLISETPTWDSDTGILTFKFFDGTQFSVDFNIEKIPVSFSMDSAGVITMETSDGTRWTADISEAIPSAYTFSNGARITFTETTGEDGTKKITADIVKGSITDEYLATDFLAKITSNVNAASSSAASAASSATVAAADAKLAQSYSIGGSGIRDGEDTDNAKYYAQKSVENLEYAKNLIEYGDNITD